MINFINNMIQSDKANARADEINIKAFNKIVSSEKKLQDQKNKTRMAIEKLANRKKGILKTSFSRFINIYEKIIKINFTEGDGIKELDTLGLNSLDIGYVKEMISFSTKELSTGQTIAAFLVKGGFSGIIRQEAEMNLSSAKVRINQARVIESQTETSIVVLNGILERADRFSDLLSKLNVLFVKSIATTTKLINEKGFDRRNYNQDDRDKIATCINVASTLKKIIDSPLLNEEGKLESKSKEVIEIGNDYINKINNKINR